MAKVFTTTLKVRIGDINYGGHLGHDRLITLLHQARCDFLAALGASEADCFGVGLIMRSLSVDYLGEAFYGDRLSVTMTVEALRTTRFMLSYQLTKEDKVIASAKTLMVAFDYQARKVMALPQAFVEAVQA